MAITLLVACREQRRAEAHCIALTQFAGDAITANSANIDDIVGRSARQRPDVILLEHLATDEDRLWGILHRLTLASSVSRVLMLCELCTDRLVTSFIANGACGSVALASGPSLWARAVVAVNQGEMWFGRTALLLALRRQLSAHAVDRAASFYEDELLTVREREILALIGDGMSNKEIARELSISDQTVKTHLHHVYVKLKRSGRYKAFTATPALLAAARASGASSAIN